MRALYPGSFDPLTLGHLDLIECGCALFDEVVVAVLANPSKQPAFSLECRLSQIRRATQHLSSVEVISFNGLTVDCAQQCKAGLILRGLRAMTDFEYELQIAHTNRSLAPDLETLFLATSAHHSFLSSSMVKEVARFGGEISHMAPQAVAEDMLRLFNSAFTPHCDE